MASEALRTQLDNLQWELNRLDSENRKIRAENQETANRIDLEAELERTKEDVKTLTEQLEACKQTLQETERKATELEHREEDSTRMVEAEAMEMLEARLKEQEEKSVHDGARIMDLQTALEQAREEKEALSSEKELEMYRRLEEERVKWEAREARLVEQLEVLKKQVCVAKTTGGPLKLTFEDSVDDRREVSEPSASEEGSPKSGGGDSPSPLTTAASRSGFPESSSSPREEHSKLWSMMNPLPPIPYFSGEEQSDGETFHDWLEQFQSIAVLGGWNDHTKLVNLTTRLRGPAYSFYRSCAPEQRSNYKLLVEQLTNRFTPVQIQAVQSQLFHDRRQKAKESVDEYAESLKKLFARAYSNLRRGGQEAEAMGQVVLANQFVSGLLPELKAKMVGQEGSMEQLLVKARFEEAKRRELTVVSTNLSKKHGMPAAGEISTQGEKKGPVPNTGNGRSEKGGKNCYNCGMSSHLMRNCPYPKQGRGSREAAGRKDPSIATVTVETEKKEKLKGRISELQQELKELDVALALEETSATMHGVTFSSPCHQTQLGPTIVTTVQMNGVPSNALIDTGSPATIISLKFAMEVLSTERGKYNSPQEWKEAMASRFETPSVSLRSYGGSRLEIVAQLPVTLSQGKFVTKAVVLVQKDAPHDLLIGTDTQPLIGFSLCLRKDGQLVHLLGEGIPSPQKMTRVDVPLSAEAVPVKESVLIPPTSSSTEQRQGIDSVGTVRLIQAVRVPARHGRPVRAEVNSWSGRSKTPLFIPTESFPVDMAEAAVDVDQERRVTLVVVNQGNVAVQLEEGMCIGMLEEAEMMDSHSENWPLSGTDEYVAAMEAGSSMVLERGEQLMEQLKPQLAHLTEEQRLQLEALLTNFADVFALDPSELGSTGLVKHSIDTGDHAPIRQPLRRTPFALRGKVNEMVREMVAQGVVEPSKSPWASPIVLVRKKDGGMRFCVDYRKLNHLTKLDVFPLPRIDDTLDQLAGAKYFTTLDLMSGYWQVEMDPAS